ncbi:hypothetical protein [Streptomyces sp. H27-D2]|uniref:hypothetical protein n=1 Tax=Streptomyces sp. H27-D2 TaxID=3046304 RepID=UPI002DB6B9E4|nr:hypothetical protein [Streptomyces sp. H27-D2]MEC4018183.1 hypothetical protein [Streptomyces sp. H27-D2]
MTPADHTSDNGAPDGPDAGDGSAGRDSGGRGGGERNGSASDGSGGAERPAVPRQPQRADSPDALPPGEEPQRPPRRWLTALIIFLLIAVPAGYLLISVQQSRDSGRDKETKASADGLAPGWPTKVQRRIYDMPIPRYSDDVAFYETNSWADSSLYVQFITSPVGLDRFLRLSGADASTLKRGGNTITAKQAAAVGWKLGSGKDWKGTVFRQKGAEPDLQITVDYHNPRHPKAYIISTAAF